MRICGVSMYMSIYLYIRLVDRTCHVVILSCDDEEPPSGHELVESNIHFYFVFMRGLFIYFFVGNY